MNIQPYLLGSGRSADAIKKSLQIIGVQHEDWTIRKPIQLKRDEPIPQVEDETSLPLLFISNPSALHADTIVKGEVVGFRAIATEKPACVDLGQLERLTGVKIPVAVCHVYRQMWGIQTMKTMLNNGELGEVISIEGRYWQSSAAVRALDPVALGSISKTVHGATNHFEINVIGTKKSATWMFLNPDEILIGQGSQRTVISRKDNFTGSRQPPFHGLGWLACCRGKDRR